LLRAPHLLLLEELQKLLLRPQLKRSLRKTMVASKGSARCSDKQ
jgi:hypothetical protein